LHYLEQFTPLRVERSFLPGSNLVLQVIDFPALDPRVRKWRWKTVAADAAQPGASSR